MKFKSICLKECIIGKKLSIKYIVKNAYKENGIIVIDDAEIKSVGIVK